MRKARSFMLAFRREGGIMFLYPMKEYFKVNPEFAEKYGIMDNKPNSHTMQRRLLNSKDWSCIETLDQVIMVYRW